MRALGGPFGDRGIYAPQKETRQGWLRLQLQRMPYGVFAEGKHSKLSLPLRASEVICDSEVH